MEGRKSKSAALSERGIATHEKTDIHGYKRRLELAFEKIEVEDSSAMRTGNSSEISAVISTRSVRILAELQKSSCS